MTIANNKEQYTPSDRFFQRLADVVVEEAQDRLNKAGKRQTLPGQIMLPPDAALISVNNATPEQWRDAERFYYETMIKDAAFELEYLIDFVRAKAVFMPE